jgi:glycosyltransferase involved in cell wall biosynthesis
MIYFQVTTTYAPAYQYGGPIRMMDHYAHFQQKRGKKVIVLTSDTLSSNANNYNPKFEVIRMPILKLRVLGRHILIPKLQFLKFFFHIIETQHSNEKIYLHICELRGVLPILATISKIRNGDRVTLVHSAFGMLHNKKSMLRHLYDFFFMKFFLTSIDIALYQTTSEKSLYVKYFEKHNLEYYDKRLIELPLLSNRPPAISSSNLRIKLLFLGRFAKSKGIIEMASMLRLVSDTLKLKLHLTIAGADYDMGTDILNIFDLNGEFLRISLISNIEGADRFNIYRENDIFIGMPLVQEETMTASIEALSCGCACLVTKRNLIPQLIKYQAGVIVDTNDLDDFCKKFMKLINQIKIAKQNAIRLYQNEFSADVIGSKFEEIFVSEREG